MQAFTDESVTWFPTTPTDKDLVRRQMNRLLETSHFKNSKRYPALFRFIVEETLDGRGEFLKERLLGIRVFDRPANYDTATDPIVRVTIAEIRKRIAQYYHEEAHEAEMRIELLPGHYIPEFRPRRDLTQTTNISVAVHSEQLAPHSISFPSHHAEARPAGPDAIALAAAPVARKRSALLRYGIFALTVGAISAISIFLCLRMIPTAVEDFWAPLLSTHQTIIFCLPASHARSGYQIAKDAGILSADTTAPDTAAPPVTTPANSSFLDHEAEGENVVFSDVLATTGISNWLTLHDRISKLRLTTATTMDDLRQSPAVLVGGLDNEWTLRAISSLRYRFAGNGKEVYWISDTRNPSNTSWGLDLTTPYLSVKHDYALIARVHDPSTGQIAVTVAGIGMSGTAAAGEFLVDQKQMEELRRQVGKDFRTRDFEVVLSTDVVDGLAGAPKILAVYVH